MPHSYGFCESGTLSLTLFLFDGFLVPNNSLPLAQRFQSENRFGMLTIRCVNPNDQFGRIDPVARKYQVNPFSIIRRACRPVISDSLALESFAPSCKKCFQLTSVFSINLFHSFSLFRTLKPVSPLLATHTQSTPGYPSLPKIRHGIGTDYSPLHCRLISATILRASTNSTKGES
jgi:hypothetical protein